MNRKIKDIITKIKKELFEKRNVIVNIIKILFTSGVFVTAIGFVYDYVDDKPKTWVSVNPIRNNQMTERLSKDVSNGYIYVDSLEVCSDDSALFFRYPNDIVLNGETCISDIYSNSFVIKLHIKNKSDDEIMLNDFRIDLSQYDCNFPIVATRGYIEDNSYKIDVKNLSNYDINNITFCLSDEDKILYDLIEDDMNIIIKELKGNEIRTYILFNLEDIKEKKVDSWVIKPYGYIRDSKGNELEIRLSKISLNLAEHEKYSFEQSMILYNKSQKYLYDITPDIIVNNEEITMIDIEEYVPAHEILNLELFIYSQVPCASNLQIRYKIDNVEYTEDVMNFVIYNPNDSKNGFLYTDEYIEIK